MKHKKAIITCKNLNKTFKSDLFKKEKRSLDHLSCQFESTKLSVILGHNGAGKTTLIKSILGLTHLDSGEILFHDHPMTLEDRQNIGFMPENNWFPTLLTPLETIMFHANLLMDSSDIYEKSMAQLKKVGLEKHSHKKNIHLSKGMGRRLAWAMASIHQPQLLILDEPYSGLDPVGREELLDWLSEQVEQKTSIILCTHELHYLPKETDDLIIFNQGQLAYESKGWDIPDHKDLMNYLKPKEQ